MKTSASMCILLLTPLIACQKLCPDKQCPEPVAQVPEVKLICPPGWDEYAHGQSIEGTAPCGGVFICRSGQCLVCTQKPKPPECPSGTKPAVSGVPYEGMQRDVDKYGEKYGSGVAVCSGGECTYCKRH